MPRTRAPVAPSDPQAVGLAVIALRNYVNPVQSPTDFERDVADTLRKLKVSKATASRMLNNFDVVRPATRRRYLGQSFDAATQAPKVVPERRLSDVPLARVSPPTLVNRHLMLENTPRPGDPVILAPTDYMIRYEGLHCIDETGLDRVGSDEPYVITSAAHITRTGENVVRTERHPFAGDKTDEYADVDSGDTRIGPRAAVWFGKVDEVAAGVSLTTTVMEHDFGDPDKFRDEIDAAVKLAIGVASKLYPPAAAILALIATSGLLTDFINWLIGTADDEVGTSTQVFEFVDLESFSRTPTKNYRERAGGKNTGLKYHFKAEVNDNDYAVAYQVQRNPKAPLYPPPVIE